MSLQGTFDTMTVTDLLTWLSNRGKTGILKCKSGTVTKSFHLDQGELVSAGSTDPREYFGQFLINFGLCTEDQLQKAFETQQETKVLLGKILVMTGLLTEDQVHKMLNLKFQETTLDLMLWSEGTFELSDGILPDDPSVVHVTVPLADMIRTGRKRLERMAEIRAVIPDNGCHFSKTAQSAGPELEPTSSAGIMLELAYQGLAAADIILRFHSLDYPILNSLYELVQQGLLTVEQARQGQELPVIEVDIADIEEDQESTPDDLLIEAQKWMKARNFEQAVATLRNGLVEHPYDPDLTEALDLAERGLTEVLRSEYLSTNKIPVLVKEKAQSNLNWSPAQRYILSRADGNRHLKSIIMVSPIKEVDALLTVRALIRAGILQLK